MLDTKTHTHTLFSSFCRSPSEMDTMSFARKPESSIIFFPLNVFFFFNPVLFSSFSPGSVLPRLNGRVAIVTGGARGMGYETSRHLASLGTHVVIGKTTHSLTQISQSLTSDMCVEDMPFPLVSALRAFWQ